MLSPLIRVAKRFAVLIPGLIIAYLSISNILPWLNDHLPLMVAILFTYVLAAYVLIPAAIRLARIVFPAHHVPSYCVTRDGFASDPLNIGLIGTRQQLLDAMTASGWHQADKLTWRTAIRLALSTVYRWNYDRAPMSSLFLFGRMQDIGFQIPIKDAAPGSRHHVRFWAVAYRAGEDFSIQSIDWQQRQTELQRGRLLWVGAASRDIGVTLVRYNAQITHLVDSDTDSERELIVSQLLRTERATLDRTITLEKPYKLMNIRGWRGHLQSDGRVTVLKITPETAVANLDSSAALQQ